jgi:hypothetical protein
MKIGKMSTYNGTCGSLIVGCKGIGSGPFPFLFLGLYLPEQPTFDFHYRLCQWKRHDKIRF